MEGDEAGAIAILAAQPELAKAVLSHSGFSSNFQSIIAATVCQRRQVVSALLEHGADIETEWESEKWRPLHFATIRGFLPIVQALLNSGAEVEARDVRDQTPRFWSIIKRHFAIAEELLLHGANIDQRWRGYSLLHHEAKDGKTPTVQFMLKHGADANIRDHRVQPGSTPLHGAARQDRLNAAKVLLEYGADVNAETDEGQTPLDTAYASKKQKLVPLLLEHGAKASK